MWSVMCGMTGTLFADVSQALQGLPRHPSKERCILKLVKATTSSGQLSQLLLYNFPFRTGRETLEFPEADACFGNVLLKALKSDLFCPLTPFYFERLFHSNIGAVSL